MIRSGCLGLAALLLSGCGAPGPAVTFEAAEYRAPLGASGIGVIYMDVRSRSADAITAVASPDAAAIEIHETVVEGGRGSMRPVGAVELPAGKTVTFASGGKHLMVFSPRKLAPGEPFRLSVSLRSGATVETDVEVWTPPGR